MRKLANFFAESDLGRAVGVVSQLTGQRPSDIAEFEGSCLERLLFDLEVLAKSTETPSVKSEILAKRARWQMYR